MNPKPAEEISGALIDTLCRRLSANQRVRRTLQPWGRLHLDRQLPFLCVYRRPPRGEDPGTDRLVTTEASYLICSGKKSLQPGINRLVQALAKTLVEQFGACLVLEMWAGRPRPVDGPATTAGLRPGFRVVAPRGAGSNAMMDEFEEVLSQVTIGRRRAEVDTATALHPKPEGLPPMLRSEEAAEIGCRSYGLEITPVYRDAASGVVFPAVLRELRRKLTVALRRAFFHFARAHTTHRPPHFHTLGRRAVVKAVWDTDRLLAEASEQFDFLLQVSPVNSARAWHEFQRTHYERTPVFHYRPNPADPVELKRSLYRSPVERVEDPALALVFREKLNELDRQITMLLDRNTTRFLHESIQLFGGVEDDLHDLAIEILERVSPHSRDEVSKVHLSSEQFAERAREEVDYLRRQYPEVKARVEIRSDLTNLMVSRGNLLVAANSKIPVSRVEALIQHEVGTHILTYYNGKAQPFQQLHAGLAGYDELQEGIAVLSEYLVGGLSRPRLRMLAARVVAVRLMIEGAEFVDTYRALSQRWGLARQSAFNVAMRTHRGGGLTKDAAYLRGLKQILAHLGGGKTLQPLLVGKIAEEHIGLVSELRWRGVLREPPLVPRYLSDPQALARLERVQQGMQVQDLVERKRK